MMHLLAPVPAVHLPSAIETYEREGRVAFGSNAFEVLAPLAEQEVTVWIVASLTDAPKGGVVGVPDIGKVMLRGNLAGIVPADRRGMHPNPALRPQSTLTDDEFHYGLFWEVTALQPLSPAISPIGLRTAAGTRLSGIPHGPTLILSPEGDRL